MNDRPDTYKERVEDLRETRLRALGTRSPECSIGACRETDPFALTGVHPDILCSEHDADAQGRSWIEDHHIAGRHNDPTKVSLPANEHSAVTARQGLWDRDTLRNQNGSPLLRMAAWIRGWVEVMRVMIDRSIGRIPAGLEKLDVLLTDRLGSGWWEALGWDW
jgi:hypothetical protein